MFDCSLYLVTDRRLSLGRSTVEVVRAAVERRGHLRAAAREALYRPANFSTRRAGSGNCLPARTCRSSSTTGSTWPWPWARTGCISARTDMHISDARRLVGERLVIGISAESVADAIRAEAEARTTSA